jgi:hypothetical protein
MMTESSRFLAPSYDVSIPATVLKVWNLPRAYGVPLQKILKPRSIVLEFRSDFESIFVVKFQTQSMILFELK